MFKQVFMEQFGAVQTIFYPGTRRFARKTPRMAVACSFSHFKAHNVL